MWILLATFKIFQFYGLGKPCFTPKEGHTPQARCDRALPTLLQACQAQPEVFSSAASLALLFLEQGTLCPLVSSYQGLPGPGRAHPSCPTCWPHGVGTLTTAGSQLRLCSSKYTFLSQSHRRSGFSGDNSDCSGGDSAMA